jgi:hypothetical protein
MIAPGRTRRRGIWLALAVVMTLAVAVIGVGAWLRPPTYDVVSIREHPGYQDPQLLARAWALPVAATWGPAALASQQKASHCGPTSVANVLVSLGIDEGATSESVLDGTGYCWIGQCIPGLTLDEVAEIAEHNLSSHASVTVLRDLELDEFRAHMRRSNELDRRYVINFLRGPLFGEGGGHHSPIGGYLEQEDLVFVLDVNADFGPWLVETERLYAAMDTIDSSSDRTRGLLLVER